MRVEVIFRPPSQICGMWILRNLGKSGGRSSESEQGNGFLLASHPWDRLLLRQWATNRRKAEKPLFVKCASSPHAQISLITRMGRGTPIWSTLFHKCVLWDLQSFTDLRVHLLNYFTENKFSWKVKSCSTDQRIPRLLWKQKDHYRVYKSRWIRWIQSTSLQPISLTSILILSSHKRLSPPRGLFLPLGFPTKIYVTYESTAES